MADITDFKTFIAVAQSGNFATAARRLSLSPAMVGRRIQALEERYNAKLIERTTRSLRLTVTGAAFLERAIAIIESVDELGELTRPEVLELTGRIRVSGPTTLGIKHLARIIAKMSARHPAVAIELNLSDRNVDLIASGFDLAVRIGELPSSSMIAKRVGTYHFVCCASSDFLTRNGTPETPYQLVNTQCVLNLNLVPRNRWPFLDQNNTPFTVEVHGNIEIDNGEALRSAALAGAGIIYSPRDLVADDLKEGKLVQVLENWDKMELPIHTVHPTRRLVPRRVNVLIEAIAEGLREV
jgi:DNA-binding transcriptional LysR family regulator